MKKSLTQLFILAAMPSALFAATYTATSDGNWTEPSTWGEIENIPTAEDSFRIAEGVNVYIDSAVQANNISYQSGYNMPGILTIEGEDASLTLNSSSSLFYKFMMEVNVLDGASFNANSLGWGSGGYYKINVEDSSFAASFSQLQGSQFTGESGDYDSGIYLVNSTGTFASGINLNPYTNNHILTVSADKSNLDIGSDKFLQVNVAAKNAEAYLNIENGSTANRLASVSATSENAVASVFIDNSTVSATGSTMNASGVNSQIYYTVRNNSAFTQSGDFSFIAQNEGAQISLAFEDNSAASSVQHFYVGARDGGSTDISLKNSDLNVTGYFYLGQHVYNIGSNTYEKGETTLSLYNSKLTFGAFKANYWDNSTLSIIISGTSSMVQSGSNSISLGTKGGVRDNGVVIMQFGDFVDGNFVAAQPMAFKGSYEFFATSTSQLKFLLGAENLTKAGEATLDPIMQATYFKPVQGDLILDLTNITGLEAGEYVVALLKCTSGQSLINIGGLTADYDALISASVIESDSVKLLVDDLGQCTFIQGNTLFANIEVLEVIPEPSTYAAIFGALALALAAYRRRK